MLPMPRLEAPLWLHQKLTDVSRILRCDPTLGLPSAERWKLAESFTPGGQADFVWKEITRLMTVLNSDPERRKLDFYQRDHEFIPVSAQELENSALPVIIKRIVGEQLTYLNDHREEYAEPVLGIYLNDNHHWLDGYQHAGISIGLFSKKAGSPASATALRLKVHLENPNPRTMRLNIYSREQLNTDDPERVIPTQYTPFSFARTLVEFTADVLISGTPESRQAATAA